MSHQTRFLNWLARAPLAESITITETSGTACPCMSSKNRTSYSEQWHRANPDDDDCNGTGLIDSTNTTTTVKAIIATPATMGTRIPGASHMLEAIGELAVTDLICWGFVNTSTNAQKSLSDPSDYTDKATYGGNDYFIRDVYDIPGGVGQIARLVRK